MQVEVPEEIKSRYPDVTHVSQMKVWFGLMCKVYYKVLSSFPKLSNLIFQRIEELTNWSFREVFTCAALNCWVYMYDHLLPKTHTWWLNAGAQQYIKLVFVLSGIFNLFEFL